MTRNLDEQKTQLLEMLNSFDKACSKHEIGYVLAYGTALGAVREGGFIPWDTDIDISVKTDQIPPLLSALELELEGSPWKVYDHNSDSRYETLFPRIGLRDGGHIGAHIDIFPLAGAPSSPRKQRLFRLVSKVAFRINFVKKVPVSDHYRKWSKKYVLANIAKIAFIFVPSSACASIHRRLATKYPVSSADFVHNICGSYGPRETMPSSWFAKTVDVPFENLNLPVPAAYDEYLTHLYGDYLTPRKTGH